MLDMPIRNRGKIQGAAREAREGIHKRFGERQQVSSLHRQRMTCSGSVQPFANTQDWTGSMAMSPSGQFRVVESKTRQKLFARSGIRWDAAWVILAVVIVICLAVLLTDAAGMGIRSRNISRLENKIQDLDRRNAELRQEVAFNAGDVSVCTEAVKLNLISGNGVQTISLTVPQNMSAGAVTAEVYSASSGWMSGSTAD